MGFFWLFYVGPALTIPLIMLRWVYRDRRFRFLLVAVGIFLLGLALDLWFLAHYAAPATCIFYALLLQCLRHLRFCRWRNASVGLLLARAVPAICVAMVVVRLAAQPLVYYMAPDHPAVWFNTGPGNTGRAKILERLERPGSRDLVLVRYRTGHNWFDEWVYNKADIDKAPVVWAHEMDEIANRELLRYFHDRRVWLLEPDEKPPRLSPYPITEPTQ